MKNTIDISLYLSDNRTVQYKYKISGEWKEAFREQESFFIEYSHPIDSVPEGVLIVPMLANILPIAWVYHAEIHVTTCDRDFYESIEDLKKGYEEMYPEIVFDGKLMANVLQENRIEQQKGALAFFSGGVDAFNTLVNHKEEKPVLITLWGADVRLDDWVGWQSVYSHLSETADSFGVDYAVIKSNFRNFLNESVLSAKVKESGDNWWHGFQHGIGIISHAAPTSYFMGKKTVYFASSFTESDKGHYTCASDPTIDNYLHFCGVDVVHDGYSFDREQKIQNIIHYAEKAKVPVSLRVCWESRGGSNCCHCEKCWRTILGICATGHDPRKYGFQYASLEKLSKEMRKNRHLFRKNKESRYRPIWNAFKTHPEACHRFSELKWFYRSGFDQLDTGSKIEQFVRIFEKRFQNFRNRWSVRVKKISPWNLKVKIWFYLYWKLYKKLHVGWRKEYAEYLIAWFTERNWYQERDILKKEIYGKHPELLEKLGWSYLKIDYLLCSGFFGAKAKEDYIRRHLYSLSWKQRKEIVTVGKIDFSKKIVNNRACIELCNDKYKCSLHWKNWYSRICYLVSPSEPITEDELKKALNGKNKLIIKPLNRYGGIEIISAVVNGQEDLAILADKLNRLSSPHIIEEYVEQTGVMHELNHSSVNTLRIITGRHIDGTIEVLNTYMRIGSKGAVVDNVTSGGISFYIDKETGIVGKGKRDGIIYEKHPETDTVITGIQIPNWDVVLEFCRNAHRSAPAGLNLVGWDVCLSTDGIYLIEVNSGPGFMPSEIGNVDDWKKLVRLMDERE